MRSYKSYLMDKRRQFENFDDSDLDPRFVQFFETGQRIKIDDYGQIRYGFISVTTGWKPVFLLMSRKGQIGSSIVISRKTKILGIQMSNGKYRDI